MKGQDYVFFFLGTADVGKARATGNLAPQTPPPPTYKHHCNTTTTTSATTTLPPQPTIYTAVAIHADGASS